MVEKIHFEDYYFFNFEWLTKIAKFHILLKLNCKKIYFILASS
jgi:hypothetical protein